eukprot:CAMPEP_0118662148 /NCGR_PEP_ID=MMETSP0785-20121206/16664_1 /TAXON_ID=91992 /ORGANISM="Bolidomonas pacifica, Strain CCMP 1866" /LENGTH=321 /DNA_ID=CAMNT_0006555647 /DNA_START=161 /DNA_END=1123 /DNA_ORIENTATION=-
MKYSRHIEHSKCIDPQNCLKGRNTGRTKGRTTTGHTTGHTKGHTKGHTTTGRTTTGRNTTGHTKGHQIHLIINIIIVIIIVVIHLPSTDSYNTHPNRPDGKPLSKWSQTLPVTQTVLSPSLTHYNSTYLQSLTPLTQLAPKTLFTGPSSPSSPSPTPQTLPTLPHTCTIISVTPKNLYIDASIYRLTGANSNRAVRSLGRIPKSSLPPSCVALSSPSTIPGLTVLSPGLTLPPSSTFVTKVGEGCWEACVIHEYWDSVKGREFVCDTVERLEKVKREKRSRKRQLKRWSKNRSRSKLKVGDVRNGVVVRVGVNFVVVEMEG